jgi:hypothetical protein
MSETINPARFTVAASGERDIVMTPTRARLATARPRAAWKPASRSDERLGGIILQTLA